MCLQRWLSPIERQGSRGSTDQVAQNFTDPGVLQPPRRVTWTLWFRSEFAIVARDPSREMKEAGTVLLTQLHALASN